MNSRSKNKCFKMTLFALCALCVCLMAVMIVGCSQSEAGNNAENADVKKPVRIGTMPTEDILPAWVAQEEGLFDEHGVDAEVVSFDSAQSLSAAITAGEVDMAMTDIMRAVKLNESGSDVVIEWITLGQTPDQGRFGVMANAQAPYSTLEEMAQYVASSDNSEQLAVGVASNTVPEYVFDKLCEENGLASDALPTVEVASLPERYALMASGKIGAAALPASLLKLGEAAGMKVLADDTTGENVSQSVMVARASYAQDNADTVLAVAQAWDDAVEFINNNRDAYRALLVANANINSDIADIYPISDYPKALDESSDAVSSDAASSSDTDAASDESQIAHPSAEIVEPQIIWMVEKGYGGKSSTYDASTGKITVG